MTPRDASRSFTAVDWVASIVAAFPALCLALFPLVSGTFADAFKDFGGRLPLLTRLALLPWFPIALAVVVLGTVAIASRAATWPRRIAIACAFLFGCASLGLCVLAMYLPLFAMAGAVRAD